jgi:CheY-like chemotaxis protein
MTGARILVVDDTQLNLVLLNGILQEAGYEVRVANNAARALKALERQPADVVLLDVEMPDTDGVALCRTLKAQPALADVPVVFLSGHDDATVRARAFAAGGADYIVKPFEAAEVLARIGTQLELRRTSQLLQGALAGFGTRLRGVVLAGAWRVEEPLGTRGGLPLLRGVSIAGDRGVGVSVVPPAPEALRVLGAPEPVLVSFRHPAFVAVLGTGVADGIPWVVSEAMSVAAVAAAAGAAAVLRAGLEAAHAAGLVHGAVDAEHLVQDESGAPRLFGLGLAALVTPRRLRPADDLRALDRLLGA